MLEQKLLKDERAHRVSKHEDRDARVALRDLAIDAVSIFDDAIPAVAVGFVPGLAALRDASPVTSVVVRVGGVPRLGQGRDICIFTFPPRTPVGLGDALYLHHRKIVVWWRQRYDACFSY